MSKASDAGRAFVTGVIAKLPEHLRAQAETLFTAPEAEDALVVIGTGALAQPDINRRYDDLKKQEDALQAKHRELTDWWDTNRPALEEYKTIKPEYDRLKGQPAPVAEAPPKGLDVETVAQMFDENNRAFARVTSLGLKLVQKHQRMFNEELDTDALIGDPRIGQPIPGTNRVFGLLDVYHDTFGERIKAKEQEAEDARIQKLVDARLAEERRKAPPGPPFPLRDGGSSPLDVLTQAERPTHSIDSAVAEYERLVAART